MYFSGSDPDKLSNELTVTLPLKVDDIVLPPEAALSAETANDNAPSTTGENGQNAQPQIENDENDLYKEYLQIQPMIDPGEPFLEKH